MTANFKIMAINGVVVGITALLLTAGCVFRKETALEKSFKKTKDFPTYTQEELEESWERIIENHAKIRQGMTVEEVVGLLGMPSYGIGKNGKDEWVSPKDNILEYFIATTFKQRKKPPLHFFHVYFDDEGKVLKTVRNGGFLFPPPLR